MIGRALAFASVLAAAGCGPRAMPPSLPHPLDGSTAPAFRGPATNDEREVGLPASDVTKVTVVDFWASWCEACQDSIPALETLWLDHKHDGVMVIGVSVDESPDDAAAAAERLHASFPQVLDPGQRIAGTFRVAKVPLTFVVDHAGTVRWVGRDPEQVRQAVEFVLRE